MLQELRDNPVFPTLLFDYFQNESNPAQQRLLAAVQFHHWFKEYKNADDFIVQSLSEIVGGIKQSIISSYVNAEGNVSK